MSADAVASTCQMPSDRDGQPVHVWCARKTSAPDPLRVLLLHGLCSSGAIWAPFVELADPGSEIWVAELPWRGTGIAGWASRPLEEWVARAVAALPCGPDVIMAHSFGNNAVLSWLDQLETGRGGAILTGTSRLRGAVFVCPLYRAEPKDFDWDSIGYYFRNVEQILLAGMRARSDRRLSAGERLAVATKVRDLIGPQGWIRFLDSYLRMPEVNTARLTLPCLVIGGEVDRIAFPSDAEALGSALPDAAVHIFPDGEHFPMVARTELFAGVANSFLGGLRSDLRQEPSTDMEHD